MKIYTSYYANIKNIPSDYFIVSASRLVSPEIQASVDIWEPEISPTTSILYEHKDKPHWTKYTHRFKSEILRNLDWLEILEKWENQANAIGKTLDNVVICCYEKPTDQCHRFILAESIEQEFKTTVQEWGIEKMIRQDYRMVVESSCDILF